MEERVYMFEWANHIRFKLLLAISLFIFSGLYLFSVSISLGFAFGVSAQLLILMLAWEGLNGFLTINRGEDKRRFQKAIVQSYLSRYLLWGVILWLGTRFDWLNFYALASGLLFPPIFIWVNGLIAKG